MKPLLCLPLLLLVALPPAHAADAPAPDPQPQSPQQIVHQCWTEVAGVLTNTNLDSSAKEAAIERIATPFIDFELMGKLALGRSQWGRFNDPQRQRYLELFTERIKRSYRKKISQYEGDSIDLDFAPADAPETGQHRAGVTEVPIAVTSEGRRAIVLHKFRKNGEQWKLYDVEIEGVSILLTYRSQFHDILSGGDVDTLLDELAKPPTD